MSIEKAKEFLHLLEARDLERAKTFLAPEFEMTFPGGINMNSLEELIEWSKERYTQVSKTFEEFDEIQDGDSVIVYSMGRLNGIALDGSTIRDVRYIDRFVFEDSLIVKQEVWNDLAEFLRPIHIG
ncbi:MAG: nuclear transport factor 2 family protein [Rhodospirillaceae bacterium]